jgi:hypothetical protein
MSDAAMEEKWKDFHHVSKYDMPIDGLKGGALSYLSFRYIITDPDFSLCIQGSASEEMCHSYGCK